MIRRVTLIKVLKACASSPFGLSRSQLNRMNGSLDIGGRLAAVRDSSFPIGLKHLIHEEKLPFRGRPTLAWCITSAGRQLLRDIQVNPEAMPVIPRGNTGFQSMLAKQYAARLALKNRRRRKRVQKYRRRQKQGAKRHGREYDRLPPDLNLLRLDPSSAAFRQLPSLTRVQILRYRTRSKAA